LQDKTKLTKKIFIPLLSKGKAPAAAGEGDF